MLWRRPTAPPEGYYTVENLPDGNYTINVTASGFASLIIANLHLDPGQRRGQDIALKVGNVDTKINVVADTLAVQTESAESAGTISAKEVANLMLNGRNFQQLATLVPGVSASMARTSRSMLATSARPISSSAAHPQKRPPTPSTASTT